MDVVIRKLTPKLLDDYLEFFETEAHADNEFEDRCYCVCWCSEDHRVKTDFSSPEKRRELAIEYIRSGAIKGYLAYHEGKVVGWCNANTKSECLHCISWLRFMTEVNEIQDNVSSRVKSIYCFTIAPGMKRKGVATKLLDTVCKEAAEEGYDCIEAYPNKAFSDVFNDFMGPIEMYRRKGFTVHGETGQKLIMRKSLTL